MRLAAHCEVKIGQADACTTMNVSEAFFTRSMGSPIRIWQGLSVRREPMLAQRFEFDCVGGHRLERLSISGRQFAQWAFRAWVVGGSVITAAVWLYGQFSHDDSLSFLFSVNGQSLDRVSAIANIFAFTGQVFFISAWTGAGFLGYWLRVSLLVDILTTVFGVSWLIDCWRNWHAGGPASAFNGTIGIIILGGLILKWVGPLQRYTRKHPRLVLVPAFLLGAVVTFWYWKIFIYDAEKQAGMVRNLDPFYQAKPWGQFDPADTLSAAFGLVVFVAAAFLWNRITSTPEKSPEREQPASSSSVPRGKARLRP